MTTSPTTSEAVVLPCKPSIGIYLVGTTLLGDDYTLKFAWNEREDGDIGAWRMSIYDANNTTIAAGIKVVLGAFLASHVDHPLFRNGVLIAVDLSGQEQDPGFNDLGARVVIQYVPVMELIYRWGGGS